MKIYDSMDACRLLHESTVDSESTLILLRTRLLSVAQRIGFSSVQRDNMALAASEIASNILKYAAGRGSIQIWQQPGPAVDLFALDFGPGIPDLGQAQQDGYSTSNTLGKGLGSIQRLSQQSAIYTRCADQSPVRKWTGTAVLARFMLAPQATRWCAPYEVGLYSRSLSDERYNGDRIYLHRYPGGLRWLHLDGLGRGRMAQEATMDVGQHLLGQTDPLRILDGVDRQLTTTRGAVGVACDYRDSGHAVHIAGIGDLHAHVAQPQMGAEETLAFAPGILGREHKHAAEHGTNFNGRGVAITASDGIRRNWDGSSFPGLFNQHPQLIAYILGNIMGRMSDDQSLCVAAFDPRSRTA
ncbi:MAG: hypothetical protein PHQ14_13395 [Chromatiales bacterium]|jgi:anti-sigma regulatory factor (Ser/Thr protein kinase)|nr:hypothetical protein [Chromatiales bacterium]MDX9768482.1 hypothetical protein [Ectothiorhodospiraceae bacterium]